MNLRKSRFLWQSLIVAFLGLLLTYIPVVGILLLLPFDGLLHLYDFLIPGQFTGSSPYVLIGFVSFVINTPQGLLFFGSFFFLLSLFVHGIQYLFARTGNKFLTAGGYIFGVLILLSISIMIGPLVRQIERDAELKKYGTPTEERFICSGEEYLEVTTEGEVKRQAKMSIGGTGAYSESFIGQVDPQTNKFTWNPNLESFNAEYINEMRYAVQNCRNIDGKTISDLHTDIGQE